MHVFVSENDVEGLKQTIREEDVRQSPQRETSGKQTREGTRTSLVELIVLRHFSFLSLQVLNVQDDKGRTALHLAVELRLFDIVRFLADRDDVDYSLQDHRKDTALHVAVRTQDNELIRVRSITSYHAPAHTLVSFFSLDSARRMRRRRCEASRRSRIE